MFQNVSSLKIKQILQNKNQILVNKLVLDIRAYADVDLEAVYSCHFLTAPVSPTCPDIETGSCHAGNIEHSQIRDFNDTVGYKGVKFLNRVL